MTLKILNSKEKKKILNLLNEQFGITEIEGEIISRGKERLFLYNGFLDKNEIEKISKAERIERIGVYFAKLSIENGEEKIRLSIEGSQILGKQATKNIFSLNEEQAEEWMMGHELNIKTGKKGYVIMKLNEDFLGTGKASEEKISNFIPKNRRLRERD